MNLWDRLRTGFGGTAPVSTAPVKPAPKGAAEPELLHLPDGPVRIEWRRSARARRVSLRIDPRDGTVIVTLPPRTSRKAGMALLMEHAAWVSARLAALPGQIAFADGAEIPVHGIAHRIRHVGGRGSVWVEGHQLHVGGDPAFLARRVTDHLRAEARRALSDLATRKADLAGVRPRLVAVKDTKSRWGSCAANRTLSFSWRLVMAPEFVQDYVAAHEVAHLRHMNHGPQFWALVGELTPHTEAGMAWLRSDGPRLLRIG